MIEQWEYHNIWYRYADVIYRCALFMAHAVCNYITERLNLTFSANAAHRKHTGRGTSLGSAQWTMYICILNLTPSSPFKSLLHAGPCDVSTRHSVRHRLYTLARLSRYFFILLTFRYGNGPGGGMVLLRHENLWLRCERRGLFPRPGLSC